jgi:Zn finger protein HypA/HybF involved in hydrogenase expression
MRRLPKWLDRAGFEADKLMRANRVRLEASRLQEEASATVFALGEKVLELEAAGTKLDPALIGIVKQIKTLSTEVQRKEHELEAINAEMWSEDGPVAPRSHDPIAERLQAYVDAKTNDFNCPACGTTVRANKTFCPKCGRKVLR